MFYATRNHTDAGITEKHLLEFYTKADRAAYMAIDSTAEVITAKEAGKLRPAAPAWTVTNKIDAVFFAVIVC